MNTFGLRMRSMKKKRGACESFEGQSVGKFGSMFEKYYDEHENLACMTKFVKSCIYKSTLSHVGDFDFDEKIS